MLSDPDSRPARAIVAIAEAIAAASARTARLHEAAAAARLLAATALRAPRARTRCCRACAGSASPSADAAALADHFLDAERRGKHGHGLARVEWLATLPDLDPAARPRRVVAEPGYERWDGDGALGYLTLAAIVDAQLARAARARAARRRAALLPDRDARLLGAPARRRRARRGADRDLAAAARPSRRRADRSTGTNPLAIGDPELRRASRSSPTSRWAASPTARCSPARRAQDELVPFGGEQAHKAFALAVGLQLLSTRSSPSRARRGAARRAPGGRPGAGVTSARRRRSGCPASARNARVVRAATRESVVLRRPLRDAPRGRARPPARAARAPRRGRPAAPRRRPG